VPRAGRAASLSVACLLVAGAAGAIFTAGALWQATAVVQVLLELAEAAPHAVATPPSAAPEAGARVPDHPLLTTVPPASEPRSATFEERAEASETAIPLGLEATLDEMALTLGEPPPPNFPRAPCDSVFVYIVTIAEGAPLRSAASLGLGKRGRARLRRPGERIDDWTVLAITDDWSGLNPDVWLERDGMACRAQLAGNPARLHETPKPLPRPTPRRRRRRR
jgi:hypothetical protein